MRGLSIIKLATSAVFIIALSCTVVLTSHASPVHHKEIDQLIANKSYLSAAEYITSKPKLMEKDEYFRRYINILVNYYAVTIQFDMFALRDLEKHERIELVRGSKGEYSMVGVKLEEQLFERYKKTPESAHLNFAIGEYLSRGSSCGCGQPRLFVGKHGGEFKFFSYAYKQGESDGWSMFRLGMHHHTKGNLIGAIKLYRNSLPISEQNPSVAYNLAVALYQNRENIEAIKYAKKALGSYHNNDLDSDTYDLYGSLLFDEGNYDEAEIHLIKSLQLKRWHPHAFQTLLSLYRKQDFNKKYRDRVHAYISEDFSNTYMFNRYYEYLENSGINEDDRAVIKELETKEYSSEKEKGAVFFNLGRVYGLNGDKETARKYFNKSLIATKQLKEPPKGAIQSLEKLLAN